MTTKYVFVIRCMWIFFFFSFLMGKDHQSFDVQKINAPNSHPNYEALTRTIQYKFGGISMAIC